jgi:hypothetical protein
MDWVRSGCAGSADHGPAGRCTPDIRGPAGDPIAIVDQLEIGAPERRTTTGTSPTNTEMHRTQGAAVRYAAPGTNCSYGTGVPRASRRRHESTTARRRPGAPDTRLVARTDSRDHRTPSPPASSRTAHGDARREGTKGVHRPAIEAIAPSLGAAANWLRSAQRAASEHLRGREYRRSGPLVMKGSGVRVPPSASTKARNGGLPRSEIHGSSARRARPSVRRNVAGSGLKRRNFAEVAAEWLRHAEHDRERKPSTVAATGRWCARNSCRRSATSQSGR